eukprot:SAG31_NODE_214_length_20084_cov_2.644684_15_plen_1882_part_00
MPPAVDAKGIIRKGAQVMSTTGHAITKSLSTSIDFGNASGDDVAMAAAVDLQRARGSLTDQIQMFRSLFEYDHVDRRGDNAQHSQLQRENDSHDDLALQGNSLGCLPPESRLRIVLKRVLDSRAFEVFILLNIAVISVTLVMESPSKQPADEVKQMIDIVDLMVSIVFTIEALMRIVCVGFVKGPGTYLRSGWNVFDFVIVVAIWLSEIADNEGSFIGGARALRALRPLHSLRFFTGVRWIMLALFESRVHLRTVIFLLTLFFMIFGAACGQLFAGVVVRQCVSAVEPRRNHLVNNVTAGAAFETAECPAMLECSESEICVVREPLFVVTGEREDATDFYGFNNMLQAVLTLFIVVTLDEWPLIQRPIEDSGASTGFLAWPIFAVMVVLLALMGANFFVAVISYTYTSIRNREATRRMSNNQNHSNVAPQAGLSGQNGDAHNAEADMSGNKNDARRDESGQTKAGTFEVESTQQAKDWKPRNSGFPMVPWLSPQLERLVSTVWFDRTMIGIIILNAIVMSLYFEDPVSPMPGWYIDCLEGAEFAVAIIFVLEFIVKVLGLGLANYFADGSNRLDFIAAILSVVGLIFDGLVGLSSVRLVRLVVRLGRLLTVLRVATRASIINKLVSALTSGYQEMFTVASFVGFFVLIFSVITMHLLGSCHLSDDITSSINRENFFVFEDSVLTNFQILTGEDWVPILYSYMETCGEWAAVPIVFLYVLYAFILYNFFVAIILQRFKIPEEEKMRLQEEKFLKKIMKNKSQLAAEINTLQWLSDTYSTGHDTRTGIRTSIRPLRKLQEALARTAKGAPQKSMSSDAVEPDQNTDDSRSMVLCCLKESNPLRRFCIGVTENPNFDRAIIVLIITNTVCLALESPAFLHQHAGIMEMLDYIFFVLFWVEFLLKYLARGLPKYCSIKANVVDLFVLIGTTVEIVFRRDDFGQAGTNSGSLLRILRVCRLVHLAKRFHGLHVVIKVLYKCLPMVIATAVLSFFVFFIFAVVGVQMYGGRFYRCTCHRKSCTDEWDGSSFADAYGNHNISSIEYNGTDISSSVSQTLASFDQTQCEQAGYAWDNPAFNFDNILEALQTLFICATTEGWVNIMHAGMDAADEVGGVMSKNRTKANAIYFVAFMILGSFFVTNLFIGVLCSFYAEKSGSGLLTKKQKQWVHGKLLCLQIGYRVPLVPSKDSWRYICYRLVHWRHFEKVVAAVVLLNVVTVSLEHFPQDQYFSEILLTLNFIFVLVFTLELILQVAAVGFRSFWDNVWHRLDFLIVVLGWLEIARLTGGVSMLVLRSLRVLRVLLLIRGGYKALDTLFATLLLSIRSVMNVAALMGLVYFFFGTCGMHLYGDLARGEILTDHENFENIGNSMRLLFELGTGHDFMHLMHEMRVGGAKFVFVYFFSFYVLSNFVMLSLFIAVLLENFDLNFTAMDFSVGEAEVLEFKRHWVEHTVYPHRVMRVDRIRSFIERLPRPFGDIRQHGYWINRLLVEMGISLEADRTQLQTSFHNVLMAVFVLHLSFDCLPHEQQRLRLSKLCQKHQLVSTRIITAYVAGWKMIKKPPATWNGYDLAIPANLQKWKAAVRSMRSLSISLICRCNKVIGPESDAAFNEGKTNYKETYGRNKLGKLMTVERYNGPGLPASPESNRSDYAQPLDNDYGDPYAVMNNENFPHEQTPRPPPRPPPRPTAVTTSGSLAATKGKHEAPAAVGRQADPVPLQNQNVRPAPLSDEACLKLLQQIRVEAVHDPLISRMEDGIVGVGGLDHNDTTDVFAYLDHLEQKHGPLGVQTSMSLEPTGFRHQENDKRRQNLFWKNHSPPPRPSNFLLPLQQTRTNKMSKEAEHHASISAGFWQHSNNTGGSDHVGNFSDAQHHATTFYNPLVGSPRSVRR